MEKRKGKGEVTGTFMGAGWESHRAFNQYIHMTLPLVYELFTSLSYTVSELWYLSTSLCDANFEHPESRAVSYIFLNFI